MRFRPVGAADLLVDNERQQLVTSLWSISHDCGSAAVDVQTYRHGTCRISPKVSNFSGLGVAISGSRLVLSDGSYSLHAALCCPTIQDAQAVARYDGAAGKWQEQPKYFSIQTE